MLTCVLRPSGIFGPGDRTVIPGMYDVIRNGQTAFQVGDNSNLWDFTYVDNVAHAHILAAENLMTPEKELKHGSAVGEAFFYEWTAGVLLGFRSGMLGCVWSCESSNNIYPNVIGLLAGPGVLHCCLLHGSIVGPS